MSGALPDTSFDAINVKSEQRTLVSTTDSGKTFRRQIYSPLGRRLHS